MIGIRYSIGNSTRYSTKSENDLKGIGGIDLEEGAIVGDKIAQLTSAETEPSVYLEMLQSSPKPEITDISEITPKPKFRRESKEQKLIRKLREKDSEYTARPKQEWDKRDESLMKRYGTWNPTRKLSHQQMNDIRNLSVQMPNLRTVDLANHFNILPEAIRRILKSQWIPNAQEEERLLLKIAQRKEERVAAKQGILKELEMVKKKRAYAKSVNLGEIQERKPTFAAKYDSKFTSNDGKIKYDSNSNHGYYNKYKKRPKQQGHARKPYVQSAGDLID